MEASCVKVKRGEVGGRLHNSGQVRIYNWGYLATRYMFEKRASDVASILGYVRPGNYAGYETFMNGLGTRYDADFRAWLPCVADPGGSGCGGTTPPPGGGLPECTASRTDELGKNCSRSNLSATQGRYVYLYINVPAGVSQLKITTSGGSGNADLYYNASTWATTSNATQSSRSSGNNETLLINNPAAGYRYISLYATSGFSGVKVSTEY